MSYVLNTPADQKAMLETIGAGSIAELFHTIPEPYRLGRPLKVPEPLAEMEIPERFTLIPESTPAGPPLNVAQVYAQLARAMSTGKRFEADFAHAVTRHALIAAIERSSAEGRAIRL